MNIKDKKYQTLLTVGILLSFLPNTILNFLKIDVPIDIVAAIIGFSAGWICATCLLRFLILRDEAKEAKYKSSKSLEMLEDFSNKDQN